MEVERLLKLQALICDDPVALEKWPSSVVYHIIKSASERLRVKKLFRDSEFEEAVMESLQLWNEYGKEGADLLEVLRGLGLNKLADTIVAEKIMPDTKAQKAMKAQAGIWFEVGEVVYNFTGRETKLVCLHQMLTSSHSTRSVTANIISIYGLGGIGKSTLAREYAHRHSGEYDGNVIWINAETVESMKASFVRLAGEIGLGSCEQDTNAEIARKVYKFFHDRKSLFIFDNVEENSDFKQFQPKAGNPNNQTPYILVTTRRDDIAPLPENQLHLDVLEMEEAVKLIQKQLPHAMDACAQKLAEVLQRLPLALQQALAYIIDKYFKSDVDCISKYLREFEKSEQALLNDERFKGNNDYSRTTFTTWSLTLSRIAEKEGGQVAIRAIEALAFLNPDLISVQFVESIFQDEDEARLGLKLLERFSMVSVRDGKIGIHRLVQKVIRLNLSSEVEIETVKHIIEAIDTQFDKRVFTAYTKECVSHGLHVFPLQVNHSELMIDLDMSSYLGDLCYFLSNYGNYSSALSVAELSSSVYESMPGVGEEHEDTIRMKWQAADANYFLDNHSQAMELLESILPISKSKLGHEHGLTMNILDSMADIHCATGDYQNAISIYDEIIPVRVRLNGENHHNVLSAKAKKARALRELGKLDEALELSQYVYKKWMILHGKNDLRTLSARESIGNIFDRRGDLRKAIEIWTEVYEGFKQVIGETHPDTIKVKGNIEITETELAKLPLS